MRRAVVLQGRLARGRAAEVDSSQAEEVDDASSGEVTDGTVDDDSGWSAGTDSTYCEGRQVVPKIKKVLGPIGDAMHVASIRLSERKKGVLGNGEAVVMEPAQTVEDEDAEEEAEAEEEEQQQLNSIAMFDGHLAGDRGVTLTVAAWDCEALTVDVTAQLELHALWRCLIVARSDDATVTADHKRAAMDRWKASEARARKSAKQWFSRQGSEHCRAHCGDDGTVLVELRNHLINVKTRGENELLRIHDERTWRRLVHSAEEYAQTLFSAHVGGVGGHTVPDLMDTIAVADCCTSTEGDCAQVRANVPALLCLGANCSPQGADVSGTNRGP